MGPLCPRRDTRLEANSSPLKNGTKAPVLSRTIRFLDRMGSEARATSEERREEDIYPSWKSFDGDNWVAFGSTLKQKTRKEIRIKKEISEWRWVNLKNGITRKNVWISAEVARCLSLSHPTSHYPNATLDFTAWNDGKNRGATGCPSTPAFRL